MSETVWVHVVGAMIGLAWCWLVGLTYFVYGYRKAIIKLQREISEDGGILDELTRPR